MDDVIIRAAVPADVPAIVELQNALLGTTAIEWTDEPHHVDERLTWLAAQDRAGNPVLVAERLGTVIGFGAYGDFRDTAKWPGYRFTIEHTVHVDDGSWGSGVGRRLVEALCDHAATAGKHVIIAAIDSDNVASIRFHERLGFTEVGRLPEVGARFGRWLTLVMLQRTLTRGDPPVAP